MHRRIIGLIVICVMSLALAGCAGMAAPGGGPGNQAAAMAKIQAGAAYLDATLARVASAVATAKTQHPDRAAAIEADLEPAVDSLGKLASAYRVAVAARDVAAADTMWAVARDAVSAAVDAGIEVLGPRLVLGLLGG